MMHFGNDGLIYACVHLWWVHACVAFFNSNENDSKMRVPIGPHEIISIFPTRRPNCFFSLFMVHHEQPHSLDVKNENSPTTALKKNKIRPRKFVSFSPKRKEKCRGSSPDFAIVYLSSRIYIC